ncbi:MAG: phosphoadenosine phosphosulfate reductase family protein [Nanoarchaeota archaeon]|nr:phosphoadenosine phosphosulfate reductase family protein [Nanoarchaeota archaeon]MBU4351791.1 phosphoadenosine phosphosulfate reductase family protein [Nanoarchaeota archaeon]
MKIGITDPLYQLFEIDLKSKECFKTVKDLLFHYKIPIELIIVREDGKIVTEDCSLSSKITLEIVRHLDLPKLTTLPQLHKKQKKAVYKKCFQKFNLETNTLQVVNHELNKKEFIDFFENTVIDTIKDYNMLKSGSKMGIALSGGKDSVAMLLVLAKKLGSSNIIAYTLHGWGHEQENTYNYAKEIPKKYGIKHHMIKDNEIEKAFNLNTNYKNIFETIKKTKKLTPNEKTLVLAQTQRRMVEVCAANDNIYDLFFALNKEDLLSEVILTYTTGHLAFPLPVRPVEPFTYCYPLAFLSKKEVGIYLYLAHPEYTKQEASQDVELGSQTAQFHIKLCDDLFDIWPGIEYELYSAYKKITGYMEDKIKFKKCKNCGSTLVKSSENNSPLCGGCEIYKRLGFID